MQNSLLRFMGILLQAIDVWLFFRQKIHQIMQKRRNSLYFSLLAGNPEPETGSQSTASSTILTH